MREASLFWNRLSDTAPTVSDGNWFHRLTTLLGKKEVGVDAAVVLLQLQMVATVCSDGVYDIRWSGWDGYKLVMDAI